MDITIFDVLGFVLMAIVGVMAGSVRGRWPVIGICIIAYTAGVLVAI